METILARRELHIERKYVVIELRENERGRYLRICETAAGRRNIVIVPDSGLVEFGRAMTTVLGVKSAAAPGVGDAPVNGSAQTQPAEVSRGSFEVESPKPGEEIPSIQP